MGAGDAVALRAPAPSVMFTEIAKADVLVHHPYDSFATSFEAFVRAAASDPDVIALKATVYRTSDETPLVPALIEAAENGKQSVCLVELKARFDERRNIEWSQALERAGVHVVYGFPNLKIHAKATLVVRREAGGLQPLRPHRHGQLPLDHRARSTRTSGSSRPTRRSPRTSPTSSTTSPASASRRSSASSWSPRSTCATG